MSNIPNAIATLAGIFAAGAGTVYLLVKAGPLLDRWEESRKTPEQTKRNAERSARRSKENKNSDSAYIATSNAGESPAPSCPPSDGGGFGGGDPGC